MAETFALPAVAFAFAAVAAALAAFLARVDFVPAAFPFVAAATPAEAAGVANFTFAFAAVVWGPDGGRLTDDRSLDEPGVVLMVSGDWEPFLKHGALMRLVMLAFLAFVLAGCEKTVREAGLDLDDPVVAARPDGACSAWLLL